MSIRCLLGIHAYRWFRSYEGVGTLSYCRRCDRPRWT